MFIPSFTPTQVLTAVIFDRFFSGTRRLLSSDTTRQRLFPGGSPQRSSDNSNPSRPKDRDAHVLTPSASQHYQSTEDGGARAEAGKQTPGNLGRSASASRSMESSKARASFNRLEDEPFYATQELFSGVDSSQHGE